MQAHPRGWASLLARAAVELGGDIETVCFNPRARRREGVERIGLVGDTFDALAYGGGLAQAIQDVGEPRGDRAIRGLCKQAAGRAFGGEVVIGARRRAVVDVTIGR